MPLDFVNLDNLFLKFMCKKILRNKKLLISGKDIDFTLFIINFLSTHDVYDDEIEKLSSLLKELGGFNFEEPFSNDFLFLNSHYFHSSNNLMNVKTFNKAEKSSPSLIAPSIV